MASHLRLDLDGVEDLERSRGRKVACSTIQNSPSSYTHLAVVDANNATNHLWDNNHITKMSLDNCGLLIWRSFLLRLAQLFDETHWTTLEPTLEPPSCAGVNKADKLSDRGA